MSSGPGNNAVQALAVLPNGNLVAGGQFFAAGGVSAQCIASWNGSVWAPLGLGMSGNPFTGLGVYALETTHSGDLIAGGIFTGAGGLNISHIARWNGASWSALGSGLNSSAANLARLANGDIVAGGQFTVAGGMPVQYVARWNGSAWSAMGQGTSNRVSDLFALNNGDLIASEFSSALGTPRIERWNGATWSPMGPTPSNSIAALVELPDGDLLCAGELTVAGVSALRIARWNGTAWSSVGTSFGGSVSYRNALATLPGGQVALGGLFTSVDSVVANNLATLVTTCPATVASAGGGCSGSAGPNVLVARSLPWTGSAFRAEGSGFPSTAFAFSLVGLTPVDIPLSLIISAGLPGCNLLTLGDIQTNFLFPVGGVASVSLPIPSDPFLVGLVVRMQMTSNEVDAQFNISAISITNAIDFTLGQF